MYIQLGVGIFFGVIIGFLLRSWLIRKDKLSGAIVVNEREDGGILYTLELDDDPAILKDHSKVVFRIVRASLETSS